MLPHSFKRVRAFQIELKFGNVAFLGEGKTGVPGGKAAKRTNKQTQATGSRVRESNPDSTWEASALSAAPYLPLTVLFVRVSLLRSTLYSIATTESKESLYILPEASRGIVIQR